MPGRLGRMAARCPGQDTTTGHWELMGLITRAFPVLSPGFPPDLIAGSRQSYWPPRAGNKVASGTEIIAELGEEHIKTGCPIVYTRRTVYLNRREEVIPLAGYTRYARWPGHAQGEHGVAWVIASAISGSNRQFRAHRESA